MAHLHNAVIFKTSVFRTQPCFKSPRTLKLLAGNELSGSNRVIVKNATCLIVCSLSKDFDKEY